jgi:ADP-ribose pyrophosphatase YjhB (NUDIX family)
MLRLTYTNYWDIPGGYVEPGESPRAACIREIREELGIQPPIGRLLVVDWAPADDEGDKVLYVFDGGTLSADDLDQVAFTDGEASQLQHVAPAQLHVVTPLRLVRRLHTALNAKRENRTVYAEHGDEVAGVEGDRIEDS